MTHRDKTKYLILDSAVQNKMQVLSYPDLISINIATNQKIFDQDINSKGKNILKRLIMN